MNLVEPDDPILIRKADRVEFPNRELSKIVGSMLQAMLRHNGCGLAAPQIGIPLRLFTFRYDGRIGSLINPIIEYRNPETVECSEGCLTYPGKVWHTTRAKDIRVSYQLLDGKSIMDQAIEGFLAVIFQHEIDHLDGILISQHGKLKE